MKILHVITTLDVGGAEMHLLSLVRGQVRRGHAVGVCYLKGEGRLAPDFRAAGAHEVTRLGTGLGAPSRLTARIAQAEIVHTHLLKADMLSAPLALLAGRRGRLISSKHNDEAVLKKRLVGWIHGVVGNLPRRTIVLSDHVGEYFARYGHLRRERLRRIYYGLDPAPFDALLEQRAALREQLRRELGWAPEDVIFTCVARFAPQKDHAGLLRAFARFLSTGGGAGEAGGAGRTVPGRLLLVGDDPFGPGRAQAEQLARELQLGSAVHFAGIRRDVPAMLAGSDAFVMSSLWEGFGLVFLEAMAAELPILATEVSAVPEVVVAGQTGLLVAAREEAALAAGFARLQADAQLRCSLGRAGRERLERCFGLERMIDETLAVYAELAPS